MVVESGKELFVFTKSSTEISIVFFLMGQIGKYFTVKNSKKI